MSFFQNTCKPKGFAGKIMVNMMNTGHAALAEWGLTHIKIRDDDFCLDIGCGGGANLKRLLERDLSRVNYTSCPMGILISS